MYDMSAGVLDLFAAGIVWNSGTRHRFWDLCRPYFKPYNEIRFGDLSFSSFFHKYMCICIYTNLSIDDQFEPEKYIMRVIRSIALAIFSTIISRNCCPA
jgi:hypothetical protein